MKQVSVIIPTYNGKHLLEKFLPQVIKVMRNNDELIIVDDASTDDSSHWLKDFFGLREVDFTPDIEDLPQKYFPAVNDTKLRVLFGKYEERDKRIRIMVIKNKDNLRFAASVNLGFAVASNRLIFLLNNDVFPSDGVIDVLVRHFDGAIGEGSGADGGRKVGGGRGVGGARGAGSDRGIEDSREIDDERGGVFAVGCLEYESDLEGEKSGKNKIWFERGMFHHSKADNFISGETAWASGGSAMFDREKWLDLEGFDQRYYPAYWEDTDISFRAKKWGWRVLFDEEAVVLHKHESTNSEVFGQKKMENISWKNACSFTWKNGNLFQKLAYLLWKPYWVWKRY